MSEKGSCPHGGVPFFPVLIPDGTDVAVENFRNGNGGGFSNKSVFVHGSVGETGHQCIRHVVQTGVGYLGHRLLHERSARATRKVKSKNQQQKKKPKIRTDHGRNTPSVCTALFTYHTHQTHVHVPVFEQTVQDLHDVFVFLFMAVFQREQQTTQHFNVFLPNGGTGVNVAFQQVGQMHFVFTNQGPVHGKQLPQTRRRPQPGLFVVGFQLRRQRWNDGEQQRVTQPRFHFRDQQQFVNQSMHVVADVALAVVGAVQHAVDVLTNPAAMKLVASMMISWQKL